MSPDWIFVVLQVSVIACAMVGGVFLTFSDFVMRSLAASTSEGGIEAMQIINRKVYRTVFMVLLLGMAALSPVLIGTAVLAVSGPASTWMIVGGALYLVGVFFVYDGLQCAEEQPARCPGFWHRRTRPPIGRVHICRVGPDGTMCAQRRPPALGSATCWPASRCCQA